MVCWVAEGVQFLSDTGKPLSNGTVRILMENQHPKMCGFGNGRLRLDHNGKANFNLDESGIYSLEVSDSHGSIIYTIRNISIDDFHVMAIKDSSSNVSQ
jgi:hypothetical protein